MNLHIKKEQFSHLNIDIIDFIIPEIYRFFYLNLNPDLLKNWDIYLSSNYKWERDANNNVLNILIQGINNLKVYNLDEEYIISINPNQVVPGTTAKLYDLCSLINYGNLEMPPYPIFKKSFEQASAVIDILLRDYIH